ncbi:MAG: AraC family transcriptional regulator [Paracoccaceae bacterium]
MAVDRFPGNFRVGVLHRPVDGVQAPGPQVVQPKQMLLVLLSGHQRFLLDGREIVLSTTGSAPGPKAFMMRLERPVMLEYLENQGSPLSKISVATDPDWLDGCCQAGSNAPAPSGHMALCQWTPSPAMVALAGELVANDPGKGAQVQHEPLLRMARGIELYRLALSEMARCGDAAPQSAPGNLKLEQVRAYILAHMSERDLAPEQIARACGIGLRSLQRLCRESLGCGPGDFIRNQRFEAAATALRQGRASIAQAAFIAGYSSPANFSTAFKREYGVPPRFIRRPNGAARQL